MTSLEKNKIHENFFLFRHWHTRILTPCRSVKFWQNNGGSIGVVGLCLAWVPHARQFPEKNGSNYSKILSKINGFKCTKVCQNFDKLCLYYIYKILRNNSSLEIGFLEKGKQLFLITENSNTTVHQIEPPNPIGNRGVTRRVVGICLAYLYAKQTPGIKIEWNAIKLQWK